MEGKGKLENLKVCKSLEAYNFFISSHVPDLTYPGINNLSEFWCIKIKVIERFFLLVTNYT